MENLNRQYQSSPPIRTGREKVYAYVQCWASCLQNTPLLQAPLDSKGGCHWWHYQSLTAKNSQSLTLTCLPCHCIPFLSLFLKFFWFWSPPLALWHVLPSVHADGAIQRSQKVWCPQIPLDSVGLYHRAVGKTNGKLENTFQSTEQSRLM